MMARFFPVLPPRSASLKPHRRRSQSAQKGPRMWCAACTSKVRRYGSPSLLMCICGSLCPEFLRPGCSPGVTTRVATLAETMRVFQG